MLLLWLGFLSFVFGVVIYRLQFHPLSKFPGPKLAALTSLYEFYYNVVLGGRYLWEIERMHEQYGKELSFETLDHISILNVFKVLLSALLRMSFMWQIPTFIRRSTLARPGGETKTRDLCGWQVNQCPCLRLWITACTVRVDLS